MVEIKKNKIKIRESNKRDKLKRKEKRDTEGERDFWYAAHQKYVKSLEDFLSLENKQNLCQYHL